jgi:spore germination cell wall hydrolase CwlJ-like protein
MRSDTVSTTVLKLLMVFLGMCISWNFYQEQQITYDQVAIEEDKVNTAQRDCLIEALWHEARGESVEGIRAVASVILNRAEKKGDSSDYCTVVEEPRQFSYIQQLKAKGLPLTPQVRPGDRVSYRIVSAMADDILSGTFIKNVPDNVLWYTERRVKVVWSKRMKVHKIIGRHKFYKI